MNRNLKQILFVLILVILMPALIFTAFEVNSLNENEKMIAKIYEEQMQSLIFSANQYVWDYFENYSKKVDNLLQADLKEQNRLTGPFFNKNNPIDIVFVYSDKNQLIQKLIRPEEIEKIPVYSKLIAKYFEQNKTAVEKIKDFETQGYRKLQNITSADMQELTKHFILFYSLKQNENYLTVALLINTAMTIEKIIQPKLNEIAADRLNVIVFLTESPPENENNIIQSKNLWIAPHYKIGIGPKGESIAELSRTRVKQSLYLILLLDLVLLAGVWLVFYNVKKEMKLAQLKSDFVSNVSHELRTPLSLIRMYAETLEMGRVKVESKKEEYYKNIKQESERLTHLINNILNFSRMDAGRKKYELKNENLAEIVKDTLDVYKDHIAENGFILDVSIAQDKLPVRADSSAVSEAVINILDNALKYSNHDKNIALRCGQDADYVFVEIEDHGIGIRPENRKKIFEKFFRESTENVHNTKGSGLGLSLVKHIIDAHAGDIKLESEPEKGSTFKLLFPKDSVLSSMNRT